MQIEPTSDTDVVCKDLIGEAYEAAYSRFPGDRFSRLGKLWDDVQKALGQKGALDMCTTGGEDAKAQDILKEVFEEACRTADFEGRFDYGSGYVDYKQLWERICAVLGVKV